MNGVIVVNKPMSMTSRDVVNKICQIYHTKKVGHTGTLDPLATGVLVILVGSYTKLVNHLMAVDKEYLVTMELGYETDTLDKTGIVVKKDNPKVNKEDIVKVFEKFPKTYKQTVPKYSAVKIKGKRLYEYARENILVALPQREVNIKKLEIINISSNKITFKALVSKGTYIRSLVKDIALRLNTLGTMTSLTRTRQGNFKIEEARNLEEITSNTPLLKITDLYSYPTYELNEKELKLVNNGNPLKIESIEPFLYVCNQKEIVAVYQKVDDLYRIYFKI